MINYRKRFALFFAIILCLSVLICAIPVSAADDNTPQFKTAGWYITGIFNNSFWSRPMYGGYDTVAFIDGSTSPNWLYMNDNEYKIEGYCYMDSGIDSYMVDIFQESPTDHQFVWVRSYVTAGQTSGNWFNLRDDYIVDDSLSGDYNKNSSFTFWLDLSDFVGQGNFNIFVYAYPEDDSGPFMVGNAHSMSSESQSIIIEDINNNYFSSISSITGNSIYSLGQNRKNTTNTVNVRPNVSDNVYTNSSAEYTFTGWTCVPGGVDHYVVEAYSLSTGFAKTYNSSNIYNDWDLEVVDCTSDIITYVNNNGGAEGDFWYSGKFTIMISLYDEEIQGITDLTVRIKVKPINRTEYITIIVLNGLGVQFVVDPDRPPEDTGVPDVPDVPEPEPDEPSDNNVSYSQGFAEGYMSAYNQFYNSPILNSTYMLSVTFTDYATNRTLTADYIIDIRGIPYQNVNYLAGDGLLLKDVYDICQSITFDDEGKLKANIQKVVVKLQFDSFLSLTDDTFYLQCYEGISFSDLDPHAFTITALGMGGKRNGCVLYPINDTRYGISSSVYTGSDILINGLEIDIPLNYVIDTQYLALWHNEIVAAQNQISYNNGFADGEKNMQNLYVQDIIPDIRFEEHENGFNSGYNDGYSDGFYEQNNGALLLASVVDSMKGVFFSLFNFEILGVNLAVFFGGITTLLIILFIWKKVR